MPSTRDLRRRIKSIKNTSQITKAMQMVSATKMRKSQNQALLARPYTQTLLTVLAQAQGKINIEAHPLLVPNGSTKRGILFFSTDKGLCGALNTNLFRALQSHPALDAGSIDSRFCGNDNVVFYTLGKKGRDFIARTGKELVADFENQEHVNFQEASKMRKMAVEAFLKGEVGEVYILYPHFLSTLRQEARLVKILPIDQSVILNTFDRLGVNSVKDLDSSSSSQNDTINSEILFEPDLDKVLDFALTHFIETQIYQAMLETKASEHSSRMIAMQSATDNAKDLVSDLTLAYNQIRQNAITNELLEITTAGAALE